MNARMLGLASLLLGAGSLVGTLFGALESVGWLFGLIDNFRFQFLWLGVLATVGLAWARWWKWGAVVLVGVLINLAAVGPYWWSSIAPAVGSERITIVSLNTQAGNSTKQAVVEFVRNAEADLVFLAEVTPPLLELLEEADLRYQPVTGTPGVTPIGLLALSRGSSFEGRISNLGVTGVPALIIETELGGAPVEILAFHTSSPGRLSEARDDQLRGAAARVEDRESAMILVGDFNATPYTGAFRDLLDAGLIDAQRGRGVAGSWPVGWGPFMIPIDHALHTEELTTTDFRFGPSAGSDHRSFTVTFAPAQR